MSTTRPSHKVGSSPATMATELKTSASPSSKITVNGVATSSSQLRMWVSPRREDMPMGMRNTASSATMAVRDLRIEGIEGLRRLDLAQKGWDSQPGP